MEAKRVTAESIRFLVILGLALPWWTAVAQPTVGLLQKHPGSFPGYTLFSPDASFHTYLVDHDGQLVNRWVGSSFSGMVAYLLEDGHLLRASRQGTSFIAGGTGGRIEEFDWDGNLVWQFDYSNMQHRQHHDTIKLPNGNVLIMAWELKSRADSIAAGRNPSLVGTGGLWPLHLVEVEPSGLNDGTIVWEWHAWDHLIQDFDPLRENYGVVADHPELVDLNFSQSTSGDVFHCNGIGYHEERDEIVLSILRFSEIWVIDHSTTTQEAGSHSGGRRGRGGDLLYRWGNPRTYDAGTGADQKLWSQHNAHWIAPGLPGAGNILVFNNGVGRPGGSASTVEEIVPPLDADGNYARTLGAAFGPSEGILVYGGEPPTSFYASYISGAQRLGNGNTLICDGPRGRFFEIADAGATVWEYLNPVGLGDPVAQGQRPVRNTVFRCRRYGADYAGLAGRELTLLGTVELPSEQVFRLEQLERLESGVRLRWTSLPDRGYAVEHASEIDGPWARIAMVVAVGTSTTFVDDEPSRVGADRGLYRILSQ